MRSATLASSKLATIGTKILRCLCEGSQASSHTPIVSPLPTLHQAPFKRTSQPFSILRHAYDPTFDLGTYKIEQLGKNLDLKTR